jgi:hypothetical protein
MLIRKFQHQQQLNGELLHQNIRNHVLLEANTKSSQRLAHEREDEAHMRAIWSDVLEVINEMTDVCVAQLSLLAVTKTFQDVALEDVIAVTVAFCAQDLQRERCGCVIAERESRQAKPDRSEEVLT